MPHAPTSTRSPYTTLFRSDAAQEIAEKLQPFVGRKLRLKILEVNRKANRLILSEKVALYEERREKRDELFSSLQVGQRVTGTDRKSTRLNSSHTVISYAVF